MKNLATEKEAEKFFNLVYGTSVGHATVVTLDDATGAPDTQRWISWPAEGRSLFNYVSMRSEDDVYFSVGLFGTEDRKDHNSVSRVVYADADTCPPEKFRVPPSIVLQTSQGHWHVFWVLDEEVSHDRASELSRKISVAHAADGCDKGWAHGKILRVPGTTNNKRGTSETVTATYSDILYTEDTIEAAYADVDTSPEVKFDRKVPEPITGPDFLALENRMGRDLEDLYVRVPEDGESWSERMFRLELELFRLGMNPREVFSLVRNASCNKYNPEHAGSRTQTGVSIPKRSNPDATTWKDVQKAHAEYLATEEVRVEDDLPRSVTRKVENPHFLDDQETAYVRDNPTIVDEYVDWVTSHTRSPEKYQRACAWVILSSAFGGLGKIDLPYMKRSELNMWLMLLGPSTRSHKSTALNFALDTVHKIEANSGMMIDIGSDATKESLIVSLGKRGAEGNIIALMHKEEATGWFAELFSKQYRAGEMESLTELYDGSVPKSLRANKDNSNAIDSRVVFNFIGVGIRKRFSEILSRSHFESGFLMRMTWAVMDSTPRKPGDYSVSFRQNEDEDDVEPPSYDDRQSLIVRDICTRRKMWSLDKPQLLYMDKAAQNRFNRWADVDSIKEAEKYDPDMGESLAARMHGNVLRAAGLLALYNQTEVITLRELLPALSQAEIWFTDMMRMAKEVSNSEFERRLDDIEAFVVSGDNKQRLESTIRRKFSRLRPREMSEALEALAKAGRIRESRETRQLWEALD